MRILVTGFEPFDGEVVNPALLAVERLPDAIGCAQLEKLALPVTFAGAGRAVQEAILRLRPDAAVLVGQAGGRAKISVERIAINLDDARIPDNEGFQPSDAPICMEGPSAYFATLPIRRMVERVEAAGVPAEISNSAGTYVCNHAMYCALHAAAQNGLKTRAGFVHVPCLPAQAVGKNVPSMALETIVCGLRAAIEAVAEP